MKFENLAYQINLALRKTDTDGLAALLSYTDDHTDALFYLYSDSAPQKRDGLVSKYSGKVASPWDEVCIAHILVVVHCRDGRRDDAYKEQAILVNAFLRWFMTQTKWALGPLWRLLEQLRSLAHEGDAELYSAGKATSCCEDAARLCNKAFTLCVTDRTSPPAESRKWGVYRAVNLALKCYFKVNRTNLSKNVIRAIEANPDIPSLEKFNLADQVTYRYYQGLLALLDENYVKAEIELTFACENCHYSAPRNQERILAFLIPLRMMKGSLPSQDLLTRFPALSGLYIRFITTMKDGNVVEFDRALADLEARLVQLNIWLMIVKTREIVVSRVFKKCWLAMEKPLRMPISAFHAGLRVAGEKEMQGAEAECLVANSIYKGYIKGYISHDTQLVVLAKTGSFPKLGTRVVTNGM